MNRITKILNNLRIGLNHPALIVFILRHPSSIVDLLGHSHRNIPLSSYALRLTLRRSVHQFEKLYSSWNFADLERGKSIIEKETQRGWFPIPRWQSFLYSLCRIVKPEIVVETGVSTGYSTAHILQALSDNKRGLLYSIDLPNAPYLYDDGMLHPESLPPHAEPGFAVPEELRNRWQLTISRSSEVLPNLLSQLGQIDIFVHDSEHTYTNMMFEFTTVWPHIRPGGFLVSDDVSANDAFVQFCAEHQVDYVIVGCLGLVMK